MEYVAKFEKIDGVVCRFDTRIYLGSFHRSERSICVGAIVGKNPGSASPAQLGVLTQLELRGDKMLPTVGNRFRTAYELADKPVPRNAFVRVWNLFYVCDKDLRQAAERASQLGSPPVCSSEQDTVPLVWFGWGGDDAKLNLFKQRFIKRAYPVAFFYDHRVRKVVGHAPTQTDFAKHTQGMPEAPITGHLSRLLRAHLPLTTQSSGRATRAAVFGCYARVRTSRACSVTQHPSKVTP
ncbi:MAG TPA: hypothetical protein PKN95_15170 [Verrucomicrobiota bacterium]|nr:hypothetical protein [Verrucomicrobiota bacterium]HNT15374.1 hypothetical protein [Verrucomicrobiota bacterium]